MTFLQDFLSLMMGTVGVFLSSDKGIFSLIMCVGIGLGGGCWWLCSVFTHLWNKRFCFNPIHHIMCGLAAMVTLLAVVVFAALKHASTAAGISVLAWKVELGADRNWAAETFKIAYDRVRELGLEDFSKSPPPPVGSSIPAVNERSQVECAWSYAVASASHFNQRRPYLSKITSASPDIPREVLRQDIRQYFATVGNTYPTDKAIDLVGREIRDGLEVKLPRVVQVLRVQLIALFLIAQFVPFGLVGWAAYRDLRATT